MFKILIVEDDPAQRMLFEMEISEMGFTTIIARDGVEAIDEFHRNQPDLVILDLQLPHQDGLIALRNLLSVNPTIPVIIHTAYTRYKHTDLSWAAEAYIIKSSNLEELKNTVKRILKIRIKA